MIGSLSQLHHYAPRGLVPKMAMNRSQAWACPQGWRMIQRVKLVQRPQVSLFIIVAQIQDMAYSKIQN